MLGNKSKAKRCLKELKRLGGNIVDIKNLTTLIRDMRVDHKSSLKVGTCMKCSNPPCTEVETKIGKFSRCGRCNTAKYCSTKCQKEHWRSGHKINCGRIAKQNLFP